MCHVDKFMSINFSLYQCSPTKLNLSLSFHSCLFTIVCFTHPKNSYTLTCSKQAKLTQVKQSTQQDLQELFLNLLLILNREIYTNPYMYAMLKTCIKFACYIKKTLKPIYKQFCGSYKIKLSSLFFRTQ